MKVLFVLNPKIPYLQSHRLGDFSFTYTLLKALRNFKDIDTYTVMNTEGANPEDLSSFESEFGTSIKNVPEGYVSNQSRLYHSPYFEFIKNLCKELDIDVVHFNQAQSSVASHIRKFHLSTDIPSVFTFHTPPELKSIYLGIDNFNYLASSKTTRLVAVSNTMYDRWVNVFKTTEGLSSLKTICNGVDLNPLDSSTLYREYACSVVGRIDPLKNSLAMVRLLRELWKRKGLKSVFIGDTFDANYSQNNSYIQSTLQELSDAVSEGSIDWMRSVPHDEVYTYLNRSKFYLNLSEVETFSLTTCEALSVGTPAIGFNKNGVGELIQFSEEGLLLQKIPRKPYTYYFNDIIEYIASTEVPQDRRENLSRRVRDYYSSSRMAKEYLDLYKSIGGISKHV